MAGIVMRVRPSSDGWEMCLRCVWCPSPQEAGYEFTELNASDTRSRKGLEECLTTQLGNTSITAFTVGGVGVSGAGRHAVIMDEVDGMAGNEDRGGMQVGVVRRGGGYCKCDIICW